MRGGERRGVREWAMAAEALLLLAVFRVRLALVPVKRILGAVTRQRMGTRDQGSSAGAQDASTPNERELTIARSVEWAVGAAARRSPMEFVCFPQTLAGYVMLRRRGVGATIVYGVRRASGEMRADEPEGGLLAHTWLMVGEKIVTGADGMEGYVAVERWK